MNPKTDELYEAAKKMIEIIDSYAHDDVQEYIIQSRNELADAILQYEIYR